MGVQVGGGNRPLCTRPKPAKTHQAQLAAQVRTLGAVRTASARARTRLELLVSATVEVAQRRRRPGGSAGDAEH
jgi:hypothetical protein